MAIGIFVVTMTVILPIWLTWLSKQVNREALDHDCLLAMRQDPLYLNAMQELDLEFPVVVDTDET